MLVLCVRIFMDFEGLIEVVRVVFGLVIVVWFVDGGMLCVVMINLLLE